MVEQEQKGLVLSENSIRRSALTTIVCDVLLIVALVACLLFYISRNNVETRARNVESITSITAAEANLMQVALDNAGREVQTAYNYCSDKSPEEMLDYLCTVDPMGEYQLLRRVEDVSSALYHIYEGWSTRRIDGAYQAVRYEDTSLANSLYTYAPKEEGAVAFSQSFTNQTDALRYFAVFCGVTAVEDGTARRYYLVKPQKEDRVLEQLRMYTQYRELGLAVCYTDGKYLTRDDNFRSDNFYDYLYQYNNLSMDERNAIRTSVQNDEDGSGVLTYRDFKGRDSIFVYAACGAAQDWRVIVSVPETEFVSNQLVSLFPLIIITFLAVLLVFNIWRLMLIVSALRRSVERERVANMAKSSFLSRMSHEIRTPLNAVIGYNTIARDELSGADTDVRRRQAEMTTLDCLNKSEIASKHLLSVINDVLDMSAIESGKIKLTHERFDFKALINSLTTVFYSQAKSRGVAFEVVLDAMIEEWLEGDQVRTSQILTNLLSNAMKFTPEGGSVTLRITRLEAEPDSIRLCFEVTDTGIGMSQEYLSHLWTPFEQADSSISRRFGGTGLGLSITKSLVSLMDGAITVDSTLGKGSSFRVELPLGRTEQPAPTSGTYDFSAVSVLAVDDDQSTRDYISLLFNRCGARCTTAASGEEAVTLAAEAQARGEPFTLCMADWQMPGIDGVETIRRIRRVTMGHMPMVVLTAYDYSEIAAEAAKEEIDRFISKPLFQSSLFDLLVSVGAVPGETVRKETRANFAGARILLAEDNLMNMEIARRLLSAAGVNVDGAWNGKEAVDLFTASPPGTYAAILMDVHMPEMNGHEATRAIRASAHPEARTVPVIAMTADAFAENVEEALASGMNDHIAKPIDVEVLFATLRKYIPE